jgi:hypothetical protein
MKKQLSLLIFLFLISSTIVAQNDLVKKQQRIEKRFIHPYSKYVSFSGGFGFSSTYTDDPNNFIESGLNMRNNFYFPNFSYEHGIGRQFFLETAYEIGKVAVSLGRTYAEQQSWSETVRFFNRHNLHNIQLGAGFRVIGKNNFHFVTIHGGLFFGISDRSKSEMQFLLSGSANIEVIEEDPFLQYQISRTFQSYSPFTFGPYLGVSKEIRLAEDIRFFVKYTQRFGLNSILEGTYSFSENLNLNHDATFKVTGGGGFLSFGLKVLLFKNKLKNGDKI